MSSRSDGKLVLLEVGLPPEWMGTQATNFRTANAAIGSDEQPQAQRVP
jgi:hypothetical protein